MNSQKLGQSLGISFVFCLVLGLFVAFFVGFSLAHKKAQHLQDELFKQQIRWDSFLLLKQLDKKLALLNQGATKIQKEGQIPPDSPFLAFSLIQTDPLKTTALLKTQPKSQTNKQLKKTDPQNKFRQKTLAITKKPENQHKKPLNSINSTIQKVYVSQQEFPEMDFLKNLVKKGEEYLDKKSLQQLNKKLAQKSIPKSSKKSPSKKPNKIKNKALAKNLNPQKNLDQKLLEELIVKLMFQQILSSGLAIKTQFLLYPLDFNDPNPQSVKLSQTVRQKQEGYKGANSQKPKGETGANNQKVKSDTRANSQKAQQSLVVFIQQLEEGKAFIAFLRTNFFTLPLTQQLDKKNLKKLRPLNRFVINLQGEVFFHTKSSLLFKSLPAASPLHKSLIEFSQKNFTKGRYLKSRVKNKPRYYLQKWPGVEDMILVSQVYASPVYTLPAYTSMAYGLGFFSLFLNHKFFWLGFLFLSFMCLLLLFCFKLFYLLSAYRFLKQAVIGFQQSFVFPPLGKSKNPLLYFYNNRHLFLNQKAFKDPVKKTSQATFKDLICEELDKLKAKYPYIKAKGYYPFDVKVFQFEGFLRNIIKELLLNALQAMGAQKPAPIDICLEDKNNQVVFSVRDYGPGLSKNQHKKVFELYHSTKSQPGLGLNVVQNIVQANEGEIEFLSPKGGGLKVCVFLPLKCFLKNDFSQKKSLKTTKLKL